MNKFQAARSTRNTTKPLSDALLCGLAVFTLKDRSLLQFIERFPVRSHNLQNIFKITTPILDTALRQIIDGVDTQELKNILHQPASLLLKEAVLKPCRFLKSYYLAAIGG